MDCLEQVTQRYQDPGRARDGCPVVSRAGGVGLFHSSVFAVPPERPTREEKGAAISRNPLFLLVGRQGFEPRTKGL